MSGGAGAPNEGMRPAKASTGSEAARRSPTRWPAISDDVTEATP